MRAAADAARRRAGRPAPELARRVDVAQERAQHALRDQHVGAARQAIAVERPRARARAQQRIVDDLDQRRRDRRRLRGRPGSSTRRQIAPPDITPASWPSSPRAASGEKITGAAPVGILRAPSLATVRRAASTPTSSASASPRGEARRGPVRPVALLVRRRRRTAARRRATRACRAPTPRTRRRRERRRADASARRPRPRSWSRACRTRAPPPRRRARAGCPPRHRRTATLSSHRSSSGTLARHLLARRQRGDSDRARPAPPARRCRARTRSMPAAVRSDVYVTAARSSLITRRPSARLPASLTSSGSPSRTLTSSSVPSRTSTSAPSAPAFERERQHLLGEALTRLGIRYAAAASIARWRRHRVLVPPTVISAIFIVGVPTPTGTDCPSLPHVQMPSRQLEVAAEHRRPCAARRGRCRSGSRP